MSTLGIYIHVPFCGKKCGYCDFYSLRYSADAAEKYTAAVIRNLEYYSDRERIVDTVYFGGGTPSLLSAAQLGSIISCIRERFLVDDNAEITLEANPGTLTPEKLRQLRKIGINRLSIGVQSLNDEELQLLERTHTAARAERAVREAFSAGFENISCDLMIAVPGQKTESVERSVIRLTELPIKHISAYILKIEEGTPFHKTGQERLLPDDDTAAEMYLHAVKLLESQGFLQYEVSNFALPGYESRHNCRYWKCMAYLGIGPSAHSYTGGVRFAVKSDMQAFIDSRVQPVYITDETPGSFEERTMLRLRLREGIDLRETGSHREKIEKNIPDLIKAGYIIRRGENISLTPEGFLVSNAVISRLIF